MVMTTNEQRIGEWMQTYTGRKFWPMDPRPEDFDIEDIAHHLSNVCRYGGACRAFYSVAQHSVLVSQVIEYKAGASLHEQLWGLLHDASEAYLGDMVRPLKRSMPQYREAEHQVMAAIAERFGLDLREPAIVKQADTILLSTERRDLLNHELPWNADELVDPLPFIIIPDSPFEAKERFLERFAELTAKLRQS
jgi:5'-deoxynucleotidase YfbR-like HD superfamily hydrolase